MQQSNFGADSLTDNFESSYAYNLLPYHPEFCKLSFAEANLKGTYRFGGKLQNTDTWAQAASRGFIHTWTSDPVAAANYLLQKRFILHTRRHKLILCITDEGCNYFKLCGSKSKLLLITGNGDVEVGTTVSFLP